MLRGQVITEWNSLKAQLLTTIQEVKTISNLNHLLTELDQASQEVVNKQMTISQIAGHQKLIGPLPEVEQEQVNKLNREIDQLYQNSIIPVKEKIITLNPYWGKQEITNLEGQLSHLRQELWEVRTLSQKVDNLEDINRLDELKLGYQQQLTVLGEKYERAEKKLDKVRDLVVGGNMEKLLKMIQKGEI